MRKAQPVLGKAGIFAVFLAASVTSCEEAVSPTASSANDQPRYFMDLCWPPTSSCQERLLTQNEKNRVTLLCQNINTQGDERCAEIRQLCLDDAGADNVRLWTDGPPEYHPDNFYGDRHNGPGISHITANALSSNLELMRTLIHEAAHGIGVTTDGEATQLEETCLGDFDV